MDMGREIITFQCLLHITELLLQKVIVHNDGPTSSVNTLRPGAVYNFIGGINRADLNPDRLKHFDAINVKPNQLARDFLSKTLEAVMKQDSNSSNIIRDDMASLLALCCATSSILTSLYSILKKLYPTRGG